MRRSRRGAASASAVAVPPASTPPPAPMVSHPPSATPALLPSLAPSSSAPQPTTAASRVPSTVAIPTQVTSQGEIDEDTGSDNGAGSQFGSESEDSSRESPQTEHLEEEQQKSGSDFADENVEEEEESSNEEDDHLSAEESVPVKLSRAQKGKQKIDEGSNVADIPTEHQNVGHPSFNVPTSATHPQLFEYSLLRKELALELIKAPKLFASSLLTMFYEGVVQSFDTQTKKHEILYDDGDDVEVLRLDKERWELLDNGRKATKVKGEPNVVYLLKILSSP
ncbi:Uncharacterized protein Fot_19495 [Forsythia ovata]|uniref:Uncharacterized protein n=1 Tax=Forsythia ovata TaxID=205694 RepID=A0ABD1VL80_9LAMI